MYAGWLVGDGALIIGCHNALWGARKVGPPFLIPHESAPLVGAGHMGSTWPMWAKQPILDSQMVPCTPEK